MRLNRKTPKNFEDYAANYPMQVRQMLTKVRQTIKKAAPSAKERISYGMPAYNLDGILVWFAAHQSHIGFYPRKSAIIAFKKELAPYKQAKGSVQFPFDKPLPLSLITRMVKFRMKENRIKKNRK
ncbi:MAG TPA: DUF1801 domain-containing protein [Candidatus Acidoferrales bacterium]|nr:DUF1801 domain-containing protein [Candidatus Acidoferrales bacterium]